jgi:hypothetical protein
MTESGSSWNGTMPQPWSRCDRRQSPRRAGGLRPRRREAVELRTPARVRTRHRQPKPGHLFWEGEEKTVEEFRQIMERERRLIYEFEITRTYGIH